MTKELKLKNKQATFNYEIVKKFDAGVSLYGSEVKAIKEGKGKLTGSYVSIDKNKEAWLKNFNLPPYSKSHIDNDYDPKRKRKLLLKKQEIRYLERYTNEKGYTIIPIKMFLKGTLIKLEIGLAKGKRKFDKKRDLIEKTRQREQDRIIKESRHN